MKTVKEIREILKTRKDRSAWNKGVTLYALELLANMAAGAEMQGNLIEQGAMLNGADSWQQYSEGGCSLIYDCNIAARLCTPSALKRRNGGAWKPGHGQTWLDVQARALYQAANRIGRIARS